MECKKKLANPTSATSINLVDKIAKNIIIKAFSPMKKGRLQIQVSDGTSYFFGEEKENPPALIKVNKQRFWQRCILFGDIGFAESYLDSDWDTPNLVAVLSWFILNNKTSPVLEDSSTKTIWTNLLGAVNCLIHKLRDNSLKGSKKNIESHYDLSNDFFSLFLDASMTYSCAKFTQADQSLEQAQIIKIDSLCQKLRLKPSDEVLEIGSGWGAFAIHAAQNYGCRVSTVTISQKQFAYVTKKIEKLKLTDKITIILDDYRNIKGHYDKIVSIEMIEAVGEKYLDNFFAVLHKLLKEDGLIGLQMIICPDRRYKIMVNKVDFIQKYIFPGGLLPSIGRVVEAINRVSDFSIFEIEDMSMNYVKTLNLWHKRFNLNIDKVRALEFDDIFIRKWNYYLQYCIAGFYMRNVSVIQTVLTRPNNLNLRERV